MMLALTVFTAVRAESVGRLQLILLYVVTVMVVLRVNEDEGPRGVDPRRITIYTAGFDRGGRDGFNATGGFEQFFPSKSQRRV